MTSRRWPRLLVALGALTAVLLSGCTSSGPDRKIGRCEVACMGKIDGAEYAIKMPHEWNGTLLVYSHGYQFADTAPHFLSQLDDTGAGQDAISAALLDQGYALAGSAWASRGWAVDAGVDAANKVYDKFTEMFGKPRRTYAWGSSLGGLVTEQLAEHADWVDGAAPMCGVVGGPLPNFDNWLETLVATQALLGVKFTLTGELSTDQAKAEAAEARAAITAAGRDKDGGGAAKVVFIADLLGLPDKSTFFPGTGQRNAIGASVQNLSSFLLSALQFLAEARAKFGGNPAKTYPAAGVSLTSAQRAAISALHGDPDTFAAKVDAADPVPTSSAARDNMTATGDPTGDLKVPTVTLHDIYDPLALAANESILHGLVAARDRTDRLEQLFVGPYETGDQITSKFGLTHCEFSPGEEVGLIDTLDQWVRQGPRPASNTIVDNLGPALKPTYTPQKWPSGAH